MALEKKNRLKNGKIGLSRFGVTPRAPQGKLYYSIPKADLPRSYCIPKADLPRSYCISKADLSRLYIYFTTTDLRSGMFVREWKPSS